MAAKKRTVSKSGKTAKAVDPIKAEVVARYLLATSEEMGATLMRTAFSPNITGATTRFTATTCRHRLSRWSTCGWW